jgi:histidine triad (HIT) family protein
MLFSFALLDGIAFALFCVSGASITSGCGFCMPGPVRDILLTGLNHRSMKGASMPDECLFCKIVAGDIPADKVSEDEEFLAFRDIAPQAPVHLLVIPKVHIEKVTDAAREEAAFLGRMLLFANEAARAEGIADPGMRYVMNTNAQGGQLVFHMHLHILGGREMQWPPG